MILYSLACEDGHRFQSWFRDSAAYDDQASRALVACPTCQSTSVAKTIMAPSVVGARKGGLPDQTDGPRDGEAADAGSAVRESEAGKVDGRSTTTDVTLLDPRRQEMVALLKDIRDKVIGEGHDVGTRFAKEARKIHDGKAPARQIYGKATRAEARELLEDGIAVLPLPVLPDDLN